MAMSRDVVLRLIGDASSAKKALQESAAAAGVTATEYRRAESLQRRQAAAAKRLAAEQAAAAQVVGASMMRMGAVIVGALGLATAAAVQWEASFADVKKVMKDPTMFGTVEAQLRALTAILPVSHQEIAAVAAAAAQLGVADAGIADFTKQMIMLGTTTNLSSVEAATAIARIANIMGTSTSEAKNLGSAIVYLGNNFATTESEIVAMSLRLAGAGKQAGMTEADVLGMSAAFSSVGIEAEAGGTAISKFMTQISNSVRDGGQKLDQFATIAGTTATDFAKQWKSDPAAAMASVVAGLGRMQEAGGDVNGTLDALGITEMRMRDALLRSAGAGDLLTGAITGSNKAFAEGNALQAEAETRYATTESQLQIMKNGMVEAGISVGQALLPPLNLLVDAIRFVVDGFNSLPGPVQGAIGIMLGVVGASALAGGGILSMKGRVDELRTSFATLKSAEGLAGKLGGFMGMLGPVAAAIGLATVAVSVLSSAFGIGEPKVEGYAGKVQEVADALRQSRGAIDDNVRALAAKNLADELAGEGAFNLSKAIENVGLTLPEMTDAIIGSGDAYDETIAKIDDYIAGLDETSNAYGAQKSQAEGLKAELESQRDIMADGAKKAKLQAEATGESAAAMDKNAAAAAAAGMSTEEYAQAQADAADAAGATKKAIDELKNAFDQLNGANIDMLSATSAMTLALSGMGEAVAANGTSLDVTTESGAKNVQMLSDYVGKAEDVVTATLQQTGSIAEANIAYKEQREAILAKAEAEGLSRDAVEALLDQMFQMPDDLTVPTSTPGATEALAALEQINIQARKADDDTVAIHATALTDEAKAQLEALGFVATKMPDGSFKVTAATEDAQAALDGIQQTAEAIVADDLVIKASAETQEAVDALIEVGAKVVETPDGKQIVVESLTDDAYTELSELGFLIQSVPGQKGVVITAPGAPEAQEAINVVNGAAAMLSDGEMVPIVAPGATAATGEINATNQAAVLLSNGEMVPIIAPGATASTGEINATNQAAILLSNGEMVPISAPGATNAAGQIQTTSDKANALPTSKSVTVTADTSDGMAKLSGFATALANIKSKSVTVTQTTVPAANGGYIETYADGGEHHVAQYAKAGTWRVWAEPETGGEWYLPDGASKRGRSKSIAAQMLDGWGYQMVPKGAQQYAYGTPVQRVEVTAGSAGGYAPNVTVNGADENRIVRKVMQALADDRFLTGGGR